MTRTKARRGKAVEDPATVDFMTRAVHRMHETGIIDTAARDRMLAHPMPTDPHMMLGVCQALLSVALWRNEDCKPATHKDESP